MSTLRAYLVEDSPVIRENLIATLEETVPLRVVGTAEDEATAVHWLHEHPAAEDCELVIIDIFLKSGSGLGVLAAAASQEEAQTDAGASSIGSEAPARERVDRLRCRRRRLVVLSNYATEDIQQRCLRMGADRVFDKSQDVDALIDYCDGLAQDCVQPGHEPGGDGRPGGRG